MPVFAEQHDADFVLVYIERDAEHTAGKREQLVEAHAGKAGDLGDAGGYRPDRTHFMRYQLRRERFSHLAYCSERAVDDTLQAFRRSVHGAFEAGFGPALSSGWTLARLFRTSLTPSSIDAR